jgi:acyl-CoA synthetase (AMP-forming)/AMP-acid ligase II
MYSGEYARTRADQPAFIMAQTGEAITHAELEARSNRLAHFLRSVGLKRLDHYSIFMENNARYVECCAAGERAGLYYTCINSFLTPEEVTYIVNNSESKVLIFSQEKRSVATDALKNCPNVEVRSSSTPPATARRFSICTTRQLGFRPRRSPTSRSASQCSIPLAPPAGPRESFDRYRKSPQRNRCRSMNSFRSYGVIATASSTSRPRRSTTRRPMSG